MIELVLKPTRACNFKCSFCSSNKIANSKISLELLEYFLQTNLTSDIIVNGGDPLMLPPIFYYKLYEILKKTNPEGKISFTTNLWDWYINPNKWNQCFKDCNISICTSFQYGKGRIKPDGSDFTVTDFLKIFYKFKETFDENLSFISVLTNENDQFAIDNILLAKDLNTKCKLNGAVCSGRQGYLYNREKLFSIYLKLFQLGLDKYENNCENIRNYFQKKPTICPISNQNCSNTIRCMQANGRISNCPSLDDDDILDSSIYKFFKKDCLICKFCNLCNGCKKIVHDLQMENNQLLDCSNFKTILTEIEKICLEQKNANQ